MDIVLISSNICELCRSVDALCKLDHCIGYCLSKLSALESLHILSSESAGSEDLAHNLQLWLDCLGIEHSIVWVHDSASCSVTYDVNEREGSKVSAACSADHDCVSAKVSCKTDSFSGLCVLWIGDDLSCPVNDQ